MIEILTENIDIVYFFYGMSFFLMGVAILIQYEPEQKSHFYMAHILWLLGVFGILHGLHEWSEILLFSHQNRIALKIVNDFFVITSFIFLDFFALEFYNLSSMNKITYKCYFVSISGIFIFLYFLSSNPMYLISKFLSRYILCLPGCILITKSTINYYKLEKERIEKFKLKEYLKIFGISFFCYGIFAGIITKKSDFFPANYINKENFLEIFLFPVELLRMFCAIAITWASFNILKIFNNEYNLDIKMLLVESNQNREELKIKTKELEAANKVKDEFIASMTHELKNPLNSILGFSEILIDKSVGNLNEKQMEYLRNIEISGKNLLKMILSILDISKLESRHMRLNITIFSINELIDKSIYDLNALIIKKKLEIIKYFDPSYEIIMADMYKIKQVLVNLISNAVKFSYDKGKIEIRSKHYIEVYDGIELPYLLFEIQDNGIGIDSINISKIFDMFVQLDHNMAGTGLGLTIAKKFIELHGGKIGVSSTPAKGSTFYFSLPIVNDKYSDIYYSIFEASQFLERNKVPIIFCKIKNFEGLSSKMRFRFLELVEKRINSAIRVGKDQKLFSKNGLILVLVDTDPNKSDPVLKRIIEKISKEYIIKKLSDKLQQEIRIVYFDKTNPINIFAECVKEFTT
ncbi:HAMP domain-containing histidine kinase [Candidatus Poribacteria bacterium]|nr:HAMP domain-containing histidine kinase [Candidatus Poribacteria bacterium]